MKRPIARLVERWLRAVAPPGWADPVLGDLAEEGKAGAPGAQAVLALRFTLEVVRTRLSGWRVGRAAAGGPMLITEVRHACRALLRTPGFALTAIATLAIAIGANTAIYSALRSIVLHPLPFPDSDRLVYVWHKNPDFSVLVAPPRAAAIRWRTLSHIFEAVESFDRRSLVVLDGGEPDEITVNFIDPSLLRLLGARPALGRGLVDGDAAADAPAVALLSDALWRERFGADASAIGRTLTLSGAAYTIVGVMPSGFEVPMGHDDMWTAAREGRPEKESENVIAKLRPGLSVEEAQRALDAAGPHPDPELKGWSAYLMTPADHNGTQIQRALYLLAAAVALVLLIACVNVASLVLSRNAARQRELAVRLAVGISRWRLIRHVLVEAGLLAASGALAGLLLARWCLSLMKALRPENLDVLDRVAIDGTALGFLAAVAAGTALLFGLLPAISASRIDFQSVLKSGGRQATPSGLRVRRALAVAQVALALMLVVGATLLLRSYARLTAVDPGFDPEGVLAVRLSLPADRYPAARRYPFFAELLARVQALPGVASAAIGNGVPPETGVMIGKLEVQGQSVDVADTLFAGGYVSPAYFATLRIPILEGRPFTNEDTQGREPVVIIGESLARRLWPGESALGKRLRTGASDPWAAVVGIVPEVASPNRTWPQVYYPRAQTRAGFGALVIRASGDPLALVPAVKAAVWAVDPRLPIGEVATADSVLRGTTSQARFNTALLVSFAACGLVLAVVGVYGVMALFVGQRQRELGIRIALGASGRAVAWLVWRQSAAVLLVGMAIGLGGAAWLARFMESLLYETPPRDVLSFAAAAAAVAVAAAGATLIPLSRARRIDPTLLLRTE